MIYLCALLTRKVQKNMPSLHWIGKEKIINHHVDVPFKTLKHTYGFDNGNQSENETKSGNKIINGDNLEALKSLLPEYEGRIKCIYIDPPYNTGNENWVYNDNVNDPKIKKWLGQVVGKESEDLSRHDKWLCMMYPRLKLLHKLLSDDGVIFISIDDNELYNLKLVCDEIFSRTNFIANIAVINNPKGRSDQKNVASAHEHLLIYQKSDLLALSGFKAEEKITKRYNKTDVDGKKWREIDLRKTGDNDLRTDRPNMFFPFYWNKKTKELTFEPYENLVEILPMKDNIVEGCWRWGKETSIEKIKTLYARFMPVKKQWSVFEKDYYNENEMIKSTSVWNFKDVNSERGTEVFVKHLKFKKEDFPKPKPVGTIERVFQLSTNKDSIILDSFAGSGTTAHAILNLNEQDGGNRKFILIEMEDYADSITAERVKRVIKGYADKPPVSGSFDFYELGLPLFNEEGNLNESIEVEKIRQYVFYTETRTPYSDPSPKDNKYFLGIHNDTAYYFHYENDRITTLDLNFLASMSIKAGQYIIYADNCLLSKAYLAENNIIFKKIPRDITKF